MKLLYCKKCEDIFNLKYVEKSCGCGLSSGAYINSRKAWAEGPAVAIGMGSGSFMEALQEVGEMTAGDGGKTHTRKDFQKNCQIITWARPMSGPGNPNTVTGKERRTQIQRTQSNE